MENFNHTPVLLSETIAGLNIKPTGLYVDGTLGGGGHSSQILNQLTSGHLIVIDKDDDAINHAIKKFANAKNISIVKNDFKQIPDIINQENKGNADGILLDLGVSSHQLDTPARGFSYRNSAKLDMRMDQSTKLTAHYIVNNYTENRLADIIFQYGEEPKSRAIARQIVKARKASPIQTTQELSDIITKIVPFKNTTTLARVFQAIRIEVNNELSHLEDTLTNIVHCLNSGGRLAVITFHSLEDRIVKNTFKKLSSNCICNKNAPICICKNKAEIIIINKKPIIPSKEELKTNPRSSSAKLRVIEKI